MRRTNVEKLVMTALMMALITVVTAILPIPVPFTGEYIHLGDSMVFLAVIILGWKRGAVAAAVGSALADILIGYVYWAPWTFFIKGGMALILGLILYIASNTKVRSVITSVVIAVFWLAFNFGVQAIIRYENVRDPSALIEGSGLSNAMEFGAFLNQIQSWLMIGALALPILIIVTAIVMNRSKKQRVSLSQIMAMSGSGMFMVFGYYIASGIIYGNFAIAAFSAPFNILQFVVGFILATVVSVGLSKTPFKSKMEFYIHQNTLAAAKTA